MYMHLATLVPVAALAAVAAAAPSALEARFGGGTSSCNTGSVYCCSQYLSQYEAESTYYGLLKLLGVDLSNVQGQVGYQCTGTTACTQQPACCTGNSFNGLIVVGCSPITING